MTSSKIGQPVPLEVLRQLTAALASGGALNDATRAEIIDALDALLHRRGYTLPQAWDEAMRYADQAGDHGPMRRMLRGPFDVPPSAREWLAKHLPADRGVTIPQHDLDNLRSAYRQAPIGRKKVVVATVAEAYGISNEYAKKILTARAARRRT